MLPVAVAWSFSDNSTFGFVDEVMFSNNGTSWTESKTTLFFVEFSRWRHQTASVQRALGQSLLIALLQMRQRQTF